MAKNGSEHTTEILDGSFDFSGGVDSNKVTTLQSAVTPNGLGRNQLSWLVNGTLDTGGILQRTGWIPNGKVMDGGPLFQGGYLYEPIDGSLPYLVFSFGGHIFKYVIDTAVVTDLSLTFGVSNPATVDQAFLTQGEEFLIIQAGDGVTLPLIWDGVTLRRSNGITGNTTGPKINEIPAATSMKYYMGRIWYTQGRLVSAGDMVKGPSGTAPYQLRDSILKVTENPLAIGGDGFTVPSNAGNIRALDYEVNLDTNLAQGRLLAFTRKAIYALEVPVTRADWIATTSNNTPGFVVAQLNNGAVSDRSIVTVNGDKFYQSLEPGIRSYMTSRRYFTQWGNKSISSNINRIMQFNDRSLMRFSTGIEFNNRMIQAVLPTQTPVGVVHEAIVALSFEPISSIQQTLQGGASPIWEGHSEGLLILQLFSGDFGGRSRAFALIVSQIDGSINVWELTDFSRTDNVDDRVTMSIEFPAFTWGKEFSLKDLIGLEIWVDKVFGTVELTALWREDANPCWNIWQKTQFCSARNCLENVNTPCTYPIEPLREGYKFPITFGKPPDTCSIIMRRPSYRAFQFQVKLIIKGWCRVRGILLHALPVTRAPFEGMTCSL